jgi:RimJ/RimL family protein N-acetyltransferase
MRRFRIDWPGDGGLSAIEPSIEEVAAAATELAFAYSDPHNAPLMGHPEPFSPDDVIAHYEDMIEEGARPFLFFRDGRFAGDGDLRDLVDEPGARRAALAILVAAPAAQGKGLGTRYAIMLHAFAFGALGLDRLYVAIVPENVSSRRLFEKLGYRIDDSDAARRYADEESDVTLSVGRADFEKGRAATLAEIRVSERHPGR